MNKKTIEYYNVKCNVCGRQYKAKFERYLGSYSQIDSCPNGCIAKGVDFDFEMPRM